MSFRLFFLSSCRVIKTFCLWLAIPTCWRIGESKKLGVFKTTQTQKQQTTTQPKPNQNNPKRHPGNYVKHYAFRKVPKPLSTADSKSWSAGRWWSCIIMSFRLCRTARLDLTSAWNEQHSVFFPALPGEYETWSVNYWKYEWDWNLIRSRSFPGSEKKQNNKTQTHTHTHQQAPNKTSSIQ